MFKEIFIAIAIITFSRSSYALFGENIPLLVQVVSNTASQLNELEKLVSNAEKYTQKMQEYNELMMDEYYKAEQIAYIVEELTSRKEISNLESLNSALYSLKYSMQDLKRLMRSYGLIINEDHKIKQSIVIEKKLNRKMNRISNHQMKVTNSAKTTKRLTQINTQNSSLMLKGQVRSLDHQLKMIELLSTNNKLLAEKLHKEAYEKNKKMKFYSAKRSKIVTPRTIR